MSTLQGKQIDIDTVANPPSGLYIMGQHTDGYWYKKDSAGAKELIGVVKIKTLSLTSAQILALNSTPIEFLPLIATAAYEVISATIIIEGGTIDYTTNTTLQIITNSATAPQFELDCLAYPVGTSPLYKMTAIVPVVPDSQLIYNRSLLVKVKTGNPAAGDRTAKVRIVYREITTA